MTYGFVSILLLAVSSINFDEIRRMNFTFDGVNSSREITLSDANSLKYGFLFEADIDIKGEGILFDIGVAERHFYCGVKKGSETLIFAVADYNDGRRSVIDPTTGPIGNHKYKLTVNADGRTSMYADDSKVAAGLLGSLPTAPYIYGHLGRSIYKSTSGMRGVVYEPNFVPFYWSVDLRDPNTNRRLSAITLATGQRIVQYAPPNDFVNYLYCDRGITTTTNQQSDSIQRDCDLFPVADNLFGVVCSNVSHITLDFKRYAMKGLPVEQSAFSYLLTNNNTDVKSIAAVSLVGESVLVAVITHDSKLMAFNVAGDDLGTEIILELVDTYHTYHRPQIARNGEVVVVMATFELSRIVVCHVINYTERDIEKHHSVDITDEGRDASIASLSDGTFVVSYFSGSLGLSLKFLNTQGELQTDLLTPFQTSVMKQPRVVALPGNYFLLNYNVEDVVTNSIFNSERKLLYSNISNANMEQANVGPTGVTGGEDGYLSVWFSERAGTINLRYSTFTNTFVPTPPAQTSLPTTVPPLPQTATSTLPITITYSSTIPTTTIIEEIPQFRQNESSFWWIILAVPLGGCLIISILCFVKLILLRQSKVQEVGPLEPFIEYPEELINMESESISPESPLAGLNPDHEIIWTDLIQLREVGKGKFGSVFSARYVVTQEIVAVKHARENTDFATEISNLCSFRQRNILNFYGWSLQENRLYLVTEYCEGGVLGDCILPKKEILKKLVGIAQALLYIHSRGFVHMDVAARNVLIDSTGILKLADMGLLSQNGESSLRQLSVPWCSPEVLTTRIACKSNDIWSFGCLIFEVLSTKFPYSSFLEDKSLAPSERLRVIASEIIGGNLLQKPRSLSPLEEWVWDEVAVQCWKSSGDQISLTNIITRLRNSDHGFYGEGQFYCYDNNVQEICNNPSQGEGMETISTSCLFPTVGDSTSTLLAE